VPIENDENVKLRKGVRRPINTQEERMDMLAEFRSVDFVCTFPDTPRYDHPEDFEMRYRAMREGSLVVPDWDEFLDLKQDQAAEAGVGLAVVSYPHFRNSTTMMLAEIGFKE
jgi:hypothetical protein